MYPIICHIGPLTVYSYGLMLAVAVLICAFFLSKEASRRGIPPELILDLLFWVVLSGLAGARAFYIFLNLDYYIHEPLEIFMLHHGGLAFQGGLIAGFVAGIVFLKRKSLPLLSTLDFLAPYIALGHAIGRVGCFLNGCCFGNPVSWGIYFPSHHAHLHPTQLYESMGLLIIFLFLKRRECHSKYPGEIFILYLVFSSLLRFVNEFFRADHAEIFLNLSIFQIVSLIILGVAVYVNTIIKSRFGK